MKFLVPLLTVALALLSSPPGVAQVSISELNAVNTGEIADKDGDLSPWVELYNPGTDPLDLDGYHLTNDPDEPSKYRIPRLRVAPQSYAIIYLSGKDFHSLFKLELHAGFELDTDDEYFAVTGPDGVTLIDAVDDIEHRNGMSYGRQDSAQGAWSLFKTPTPGEPNRNPILGLVADTRFTIDRGFYTEPIQVEITTATEGARIIYTTSGRPPGEGTIFTGPIEHVYDGPITISETTVLRAAAFKEGHAPSNVDTQTYIFPDDVIKQPDMRTAITESPVHGPKMIESLTSIPSISLAVENLDRVAKGGSSGNDEEYHTSVELLNPDGTKGFQVNAGVSRFGGYYTDFPKKSFRLYFRKRYGTGKLRYPLYRGHESGYPPAEEFDSINLRSGSHDMNARGAYLSNRFVDDTLLEMGHIAPHGRFVHVYLNGLYWGQYHLRERWNAAMFASYFGGKEDDYDAINGNNTGDEFLPGDPYDGDREFWTETLALSREARPYAALLPNHLDMGSYLSFMLTWMSGNSESEFQSAGSRSQGVPFKFYFKDADGYLREPPNRVSNRGPGDIFQRLRQADELDFRIHLADTIHKHYFNDGAFTPDRNIERLRRRVEETQLSFLAESARWNFHSPEAWQRYQDNLMERHFPDLTQTMIRRFRDAGWLSEVTAPTFTQHGGAISSGFLFTMEAGTLFKPQAGDLLYTIDGSDPRSPGGARNPDARLYPRKGAGVALTNTTTIKARTQDPQGNWSALTEATFHLGREPAPGDLIISEIHYRPSEPSTAETAAGFTSRNDFEFLELHNRSQSTLSLINLTLVDGVRFDFAQSSLTHLDPGGVILLAANPQALTLRYGPGLPIAGAFTEGNLANGGETIRMTLRAGEPLQTLRYDDKAPWPVEADGQGRSLTLRSPGSMPAPEDSAAWQASHIEGGTPGRLEGATPAPGTEDADGDGLPAFVEAALGSSDENAASGPSHLRLHRDGDTVVLDLKKSPQASAERFAVEVSEDLRTWSAGGFTLDPAAGSPENLRWTSSLPGTSQRYVRLRVSLTAP